MLRARFVLLVLLLAPFAGCRPAPSDRPPNIVYILADDLGYGEVGAYGQALIQTPHLDRLAAEGMRFTQHYAGSPVCAPSRAVLLTGKHTGHAAIRDNYELGGWGPDEPEGQLPLPDAEVTLAEMLRTVGYATGFVGKWGLGGPGSEGHPNRQGFDRFYGYLCQRVAHNYYPTHLWADDRPDSLAGNTYFSAHQRLDAPLPTEEAYYDRYLGTTYAPDRLLDEALAFIRQHQDGPFFLTFATPVPHLAMQVPPEALDPYRGAFEETPYLGDNGYLPHPLPRAGYAAMITRMDRDIGRILDLLDDLGLAEDTIVLFSSDNGTTYVGGVEADFFDSTGPLRGLKGSVYEGGIRVPFLVRWPGRVAPGTVTDEVSAFWDVLPTLADVTGAAPPSEIDGRSLLPTLLGRPEAQAPPDALYWEYHSRGGMQAVRLGDWKGIRLNLRTDPAAAIALYDLAADPGETTDVAAAHPDVIRRIEAVMAARTPSPVPRWNFRQAEER